ncbi:nuclear transport factor 2 family protein [Sphingopyxis panaciterrae]
MADLPSDRDEIRDLLARYTYHGDRGRLDAMTGCFAGDGVLEYLGKAPKGPAAIKAALSAGRRDPRLTFVRHHITNPLIAVEGDQATARSYFTVHSNFGPDHSGTYDDRLERTADGWRFAHRRVRIDWQAEASLFEKMTSR